MKIAITEVLPFDPRGKRCTAGLVTALFLTAFPSGMAAHKTSYQPENGFVTQIKSGEADVLQAVEGVTEDQIIHGTYSYEKQRTLYGAHATSDAPIFGRWDDAGRAFYKVAREIIAPRFFKDSGDIGTIWVRYVVEAVDHSQTKLRIDAIFVDARNVIHPSAGEVEAAEYRAIQDRLANQDEKQLTQESTQENKESGGQSREERQVSKASALGLTTALSDASMQRTHANKRFPVTSSLITLKTLLARAFRLTAIRSEVQHRQIGEQPFQSEVLRTMWLRATVDKSPFHSSSGQNV